jgi:hypothetical protein
MREDSRLPHGVFPSGVVVGDGRARVAARLVDHRQREIHV